MAYLVGVLAGFRAGRMTSQSFFAGKRKGIGVALGVSLVALLLWWRATGHTDAIFHLNIPHGDDLLMGCFLGYLFGSVNTKSARADQTDETESPPSSP